MRAVAATMPEERARPTFHEVYADHFDMVWRLVASRVPASALDDVVQEVFLVVHRKLPEFEGRSSVRTWLYGIVRFVSRDYLRHHGHRSLGAPLDDDLPADTQSPDGALARKQALAVLDEALEKMSDEQREAFLLMELEQLTSREASEVLDVNDNTVRTRVRAARAIFSAAVARFRAKQQWRNDDG